MIANPVLETPRERVVWNDDELVEIATWWIKLRLKDPFESPHLLVNQAQEHLPPNRRRSLSSVHQVPPLKSKIDLLWDKEINRPAPVPQIINIPVPEPVNYIDLAQRLDNATLGAILIQRLEKIFDKSRNGDSVEVIPPHKAPISILQQASKEAVIQQTRPPRVAMCSMEEKLYKEVLVEVDKFKLGVEVRFVDMNRSHVAIPASADFVLFTDLVNGGPVWKSALAGWERSRVFVSSGRLADIVQKLRDILALKVKLATKPE